jgi:hypothetical protein
VWEKRLTDLAGMRVHREKASVAQIVGTPRSRSLVGHAGHHRTGIAGVSVVIIGIGPSPCLEV